MNVIVANEKKDELANIDVDVIKNITGQYDADELVAMFKNFFFDRMILDLTAVKQYKDLQVIQKLSMELGADKLLLILPDEEAASSNYLSTLISMGIYNFTNNVSAVKGLVDKPNEYKDVAKIQQLNNLSIEIANRASNGQKIIGFENVTEHAGATTLIYILKKELKKIFSVGVYAIEVNKKDFIYFNDKEMFSVEALDLGNKISSLKNASIILVDLNNTRSEASCDDVVYLIEPTTLKLNKMIRKDRKIFDSLSGKKIVLNKSLLSNKDVSEFESESNSKIFYNIPPLDERISNNVINDFSYRLGLINETAAKKESSGKIFGLFKV